MSTILAGLGKQRCLPAAAGGPTCRLRCNSLPVTAVISLVAYEQLLATGFGQSG